jgi:citrate lyase synthetase
MEEINQIAFNINAVVELKEVSGPYLKIDRKFFGVGQANEMTEEYSEQFQKIVGKLITVNKVLVSEIRKQQSLTLHEQVTANTIEEALEKGGIYLATIPDFRRDDGTTFFGGHVLLCFTNKSVTIGGEYSQLFSDGNQYF